MKYYFVTIATEGKYRNQYICTELPFDPMSALLDFADLYKTNDVAIVFYHEISPEVGTKYMAAQMIQELI